MGKPWELKPQGTEMAGALARLKSWVKRNSCPYALSLLVITASSTIFWAGFAEVGVTSTSYLSRAS
jgi:hypothetical protein